MEPEPEPAGSSIEHAAQRSSHAHTFRVGRGQGAPLSTDDDECLSPLGPGLKQKALEK